MSSLLGYLAGFLTNAVIFALFVLGLNLQFGFTGLINFGHVAFMALGAYTAVMLTMHGAPVAVSVAAAIVLPALFSFALGFPSLRLREDYLAIVTIGFAEVVQMLLNGAKFTGGPEGLTGYQAPLSWLPVPYDLWRWIFFAVCLLITGVVFILLEYLTRSPWGRVLTAIREDEEVAVTLGKNVVGYKLTSFAFGAAIAGLAGALLAYFLLAITPHTFDALITFEAWTIMVLGGVGRNGGAVLGAVLYYGFFSSTAMIASSGLGPLSADQVASLRVAFIGLLLILLMMYRPQGILGRKEELGLDR